MTPTASGPTSAPVWSSPSRRPKAQPCPMTLPALESIASRGGLRIPFPIRSSMINSTATCTLPASARAQTDQCQEADDQGGEQAES